ncbi:helix-turn-helix domain-containing protein [Pseudothauera lacus]|uniref:Uncharacterized protein n=1 Tax=Pseudothauera lacus TaxID=2136175 RepID=A0A2T4IDJ3_9RHOO|nr:hypothetical protein [Pseudothauera lacus]PTD95833.1 hypothetical protein C8261_12590 [Pseudothauera lacus]
MAQRLTSEQWTIVRQKYETDPRLSFSDLASQFGVSKQAVHKRATAEKWERVVSLAELAARAQTKADHLVDGEVDAARLASIRESGVDEAAARRAAILERHRREVDGPRKIVYQALQSGDVEKAKLAKVIADSLKTVQDLERKAWGLDAVVAPRGEHVIVIERD